jgi:ribosome-associated toxin RatA of RatAB toxin-antitoxin module
MTTSCRDQSQGLRRFAAAVLLVAASTLLAAPGRAAYESAELEAPAALVWSVLTDFDGWPGFMPGLNRVEVQQASPERVAIRHETEKLGFEIAFTALTRVDHERMRLELALDPSAANDLRAMEASWQLTELSNGRVRVDFRSELDSGQPVPRLLERRMVGQSVAEALAALAGEVERRRAAPPLVAARAR